MTVVQLATDSWYINQMELALVSSVWKSSHKLATDHSLSFISV